ncbi:apolipoprotein N-acyltransferase [Rhodobacteraceae bacterium GS-10]|uniref:Apolipoprotein N-acyltransferase n=2 Tax=Thalassovita mangrovi TaxID=2692236 RepID=A0A6L8LM85_9RHOB|nr:apolipoprotein N-acyltransferase [Thalassovita mangrovi]MYM57158.1 apolipoprotein N-acyltransferase [Thalassovita mangrovi]
MGVAAVFGALAATGQAPFDLWQLALVGFAGLYSVFLTAGTARRAGWAGWAGGTGYFALALCWIVEPFLVDIARHGWMAPFALLFMAAGLALFWGAAMMLAHRLGRGAIVWIGALALAELVRSYVFTGFPWALIGHIWIPTAMAQWAGFVGPHGLSLIALASAVALRQLFTAHPARAVVPVLLLAGLFAGGAYLAASGPAPRAAPVVRLIQPNAPQHQKWDPDYVPIFFRRLVEATAADPRPDLIVWPETSVPVYLEYAEETLKVIAEAASGVPVVLGAQREEGERIFNSAAVLDGQGRIAQVYDKHHLVPFGEYVPLGDLMARFGIHGMAAREGAGFSAGPGPALFDLGALGTALPLICYEAVFPQDVGAAPQRPGFLLQITNDAWFGRFSGPYQHLSQARLRAIEQGLPMVRVANTGVSAVIDARGRITGSVPLGLSGWIDLPLPEALPPTIYARIGDLFAAGAILALFLAVIGNKALQNGRKAD